MVETEAPHWVTHCSIELARRCSDVRNHVTDARLSSNKITHHFLLDLSEQLYELKTAFSD